MRRGCSLLGVSCRWASTRPLLRALTRPLMIFLLCSPLHTSCACHLVALWGSLGGSSLVAAPPSSKYNMGFSPTRACRWDYWRYSSVSSFGPLLEHLEPLHNRAPLSHTLIGAGGSYAAAGKWLWSWPAAGLRRYGGALPCITAPCQALWGTVSLAAPLGGVTKSQFD